MTVTPVTRATSTPRMTTYMSVDMFKSNGRRGVDVDKLVAGGRSASQDGALAEYIDEASNWMDHICQQTLAATTDRVQDRVNVNRNGYVTIHPRYRPVVALLAFAIGATPTQLYPLASLAGVGFNTDQSFVVPAWQGVLPVNTSQGPIRFGYGGGPQDQAYVDYTYINGAPITSLTAPITAGDTVVQLADTTGVVANQTWFTVFATDPGKRSTFRATSVSTGPGGTGPGTVGCPAMPFAVNINGPYPVMVSALDKSCITACVLATRAFIKDAAPQAVLGNAAGATSSDEDLVEAAALLRDFVAPVA